MNRHAEPDHRLSERLGSFRHAIVVPTYDEGRGVEPLLDSLPRRSNTLVILVVNAPADAAPERLVSNAQTVEAARERGETRRI